MADITLTSKPVNDGNDVQFSTQLYTDPNNSNRVGPVTALILADGTVLRLGQAAMALSLPVVVASNQSAIPVTAGAGSVSTVSGDVAHDAADSGNPVKIGGVARAAEATAVTAGDRVNASYTLTGRALAAVLDNNEIGDGIPVSRAVAETGNLRALAVGNLLYDAAAGDWNRVREVVNGQNTDGTGIQAVGTLAQFDDSSPGVVTENNFAPLRISANRRLMVVQTNGRLEQVAVTTTASPDYSANDVIDGIKEITDLVVLANQPAMFKSLTLKDKSGQAPALTVILFKATPAGGTYTDNAALVFGAGDAANIAAVVKILTTDWITLAGVSMVSFGDINVLCAVAASSMYALIIADATWNAASTSDLTMEVGFEQR